MYLLDTNIVSELRRPKPHGAVLAWAKAQPVSALHLSSVTIGELQAGIEKLRERDHGKAAAIETWLEQAISGFVILSMDAPCFRVCARLMHRASRSHFEDAMIAATAIVHGLTVATRNVRDFKPFGVPVFNPFDDGSKR
jgi:toxin FitB